MVIKPETQMLLLLFFVLDPSTLPVKVFLVSRACCKELARPNQSVTPYLYKTET